MVCFFHCGKMVWRISLMSTNLFSSGSWAVTGRLSILWFITWTCSRIVCTASGSVSNEIAWGNFKLFILFIKNLFLATVKICFDFAFWVPAKRETATNFSCEVCSGKGREGVVIGSYSERSLYDDFLLCADFQVFNQHKECKDIGDFFYFLLISCCLAYICSKIVRVLRMSLLAADLAADKSLWKVERSWLIALPKVSNTSFLVMSLPFLSVKNESSKRVFIIRIKLTLKPFLVDNCRLLLVGVVSCSVCSRSFIFLSIMPQVSCGYCFLYRAKLMIWSNSICFWLGKLCCSKTSKMSFTSMVEVFFFRFFLSFSFDFSFLSCLKKVYRLMI